jgi:hypothetical protein
VGFFFGGAKGVLRYRRLDRARIKQATSINPDQNVKGFHIATAHFFQQGTRYAINTALCTGAFTAVDIYCRQQRFAIPQLDQINETLNNPDPKLPHLPKNEQFRLEHKALAGLTAGSTFASLAAISNGNFLGLLGYGAVFGVILGTISAILLIPVEAGAYSKYRVHKEEEIEEKEQEEDEATSLRNLVQDESHLLEMVQKSHTALDQEVTIIKSPKIKEEIHVETPPESAVMQPITITIQNKM